MNMLTKQQIFDKAVGGILRQRTLGKSGTNNFYRENYNRKGTACVVGQLIPDRFYVKDIEPVSTKAFCINSWENHFCKEALLLGNILHMSGIDVDNIEIANLLDKLQYIHDHANGVRGFSLGCRKIAKDFGLNSKIFKDE